MSCQLSRSISPESTQRDDPGEYVTWISGATSKLATQGIKKVLNDLPQARQDAGHLRRILQREQPQSETVRAYRDLVGRVIKRPVRNLSIEAAS